MRSLTLNVLILLCTPISDTQTYAFAIDSLRHSHVRNAHPGRAANCRMLAPRLSFYAISAGERGAAQAV
jgi:hypothetical protein